MNPSLSDNRPLTHTESQHLLGILLAMVQFLGVDRFLDSVQDLERFYNEYFKGVANGLTGNQHHRIKDEIIAIIDETTYEQSLKTVRVNAHLETLALRAVLDLGAETLAKQLGNELEHSQLINSYLQFDSSVIFGKAVPAFDDRTLANPKQWVVLTKHFLKLCQYHSLDKDIKILIDNAYQQGFDDAKNNKGFIGLKPSFL